MKTLLCIFLLLLPVTCLGAGFETLDEPAKILWAKTKVGEELVLHLETNPSTGYGWIIENLPQGLSLESRIYVDKKSPSRSGSPALEKFIFKTSVAGRVSFNLLYVRPWEKAVPPAKVLTCIIEIN